MKPNHRRSLANKYTLKELKNALENYTPRNSVKGNLNGMYNQGNGEKYVRIRINGEKVRRSHIVWRISNRKKIPKGYNIHHKDENKRNDNIENLELVKEKEHSIRNLQEVNNGDV